MSKYSQLRALMGGTEDFNDTASCGRVLKWFVPVCADNKARTLLAAQITKKLRPASRYVDRVEVKSYDRRGDKACVFITEL